MKVPRGEETLTALPMGHSNFEKLLMDVKHFWLPDLEES